MWYTRLKFSKAIEADAERMLSKFGSSALINAQSAARQARGKDKKRAEHFARVSLKIAEVTGQELTSSSRTQVAPRPPTLNALSRE